MMIEISEVSGIGEFEREVQEKKEGEFVRVSEDFGESFEVFGDSERASRDEGSRGVFERREVFRRKGGKVFFVRNKNTIEVRTDEKLRKLLTEKYESVMESRYFGRGGIEIVSRGGQLEKEEIEDLVRLSYNLSKA
ncbi:hypothetical protein IKG02_01085 [Candidatus Saccharibacteria bacterium]|nr:hypothetical protein [Candidatus Saccharibacteria bacterium]